MFVDPCIIAQFIKKNPTRCNSVSKFIIQYLYEAQHVSGDTPPIIRSLKLPWFCIRERLLDVEVAGRWQRVCVCVCVCVCVYIYIYIYIYIYTHTHTDRVREAENRALRNAECRIYQGVLYYPNRMTFHGTRVNVISPPATIFRDLIHPLNSILCITLMAGVSPKSSDTCGK